MTNNVYNGEITVPACAQGDKSCIRFLEHVQLKLTMSSSRRGDLMVGSVCTDLLWLHTFCLSTLSYHLPSVFYL